LSWVATTDVLARGLLIVALAAPLLVALGLLTAHTGCRRLALRVAPWTAVPAVACVVWSAGAEIDLRWLLLGTRLGLDGTGRVFLGFTASLWLAAGVYGFGYFKSESEARRFFIYFQLSMVGNFGLILALDAISFFVFFTLMSFAAYGLIVHEQSVENLRAGRVYMILVILGEILLFTALLALSSNGEPASLPIAGSQGVSTWVLALLIAGFGIKAGVLPLHVWLPLAHSAAPTPASAVLSGAMIKAGLLGWLRFLPIGEASMPEWGVALMVAGVIAAFYGVVVGVVQRNPKTVLAYSSISQMGYMTVAVGAGLSVPHAWPAILAATLVYAVHHALAKGALFLGVGAAASATKRTAVMLGLALPALALAGAPFSSGAIAKFVLHSSLSDVGVPQVQSLLVLLSIAAVGTTILMVRFLLVVGGTGGKPHTLSACAWWAWCCTLIGVFGAVYLLPGNENATTRALLVVRFPALAWPLALGVAIALVAWRLSPPLDALPRPLRIPAGDLLVAVSSLMRWLRGSRTIAAAIESIASTSRPLCGGRSIAVLRVVLTRGESALRSWYWVGMCFLIIVLTLAALLAST
jgi:formate hydrogenlyase subunit 3/multisubunit Na+/H+ antiporter MnhD subunit